MQGVEQDIIAFPGYLTEMTPETDGSKLTFLGGTVKKIQNNDIKKTLYYNGTEKYINIYVLK